MKVINTDRGAYKGSYKRIKTDLLSRTMQVGFQEQFRVGMMKEMNTDDMKLQRRNMMRG